jgi:hypothetical protein
MTATTSTGHKVIIEGALPHLFWDALEACTEEQLKDICERNGIPCLNMSRKAIAFAILDSRKVPVSIIL